MRRVSTFSAFLPLALAQARKSRLTICTNALVSKVVFESSSSGSPRAIGVEFKGKDQASGDPTFFVKARREIILSCGALGSPQLLLLR